MRVDQKDWGRRKGEVCRAGGRKVEGDSGEKVGV